MKLRKQDKIRLKVLWVLLNSSTDFNYPNDEVCKVMDAIEKKLPSAPIFWKQPFKIIINEKVEYEHSSL